MSHTILAVCTGCTACVKVCPVEAITGERKNLHGIDPAICIDCGACGRICPADAVVDAHQKPVAMLKRSQWLKPLVSEKKCISFCRVEAGPSAGNRLSAGRKKLHRLLILRGCLPGRSD
jgi:ferredoxin